MTKMPWRVSSSAMLQPSSGAFGSFVLVAEVALPQPIVDVVAAEVARDALQQIRLFERRARAHERAEPAGAAALGGLLQRADGRRQRVLPR